MSQDYNSTISLPKTDFPMRAGLPKREPEMLKSFNEKKIYENLMKKNAGKPTYILHDGPPYANGDIHLGHALNKILKDIIVRYKNMAGYLAPYTPGWDTHGMPIETAIIKKNKLDRKKMSIPEFRNACHDFAMDYIDKQREQMKRLGAIGDWDNPYITLDPVFEAEEVRVFGKMYEKGYIYQGLKPVYWCPHDETALAEAEIEHSDDPCSAIYVKFRIKDDKGLLSDIPNSENASILIWTTTAWTLPGNLAISLGPDIEYAFCKVGDEIFIVATELAKAVFEKAGIENYEILKKLPGRAFDRVTTKHPLFDRESLVIIGDHVTVEAGTGCVHTAPGHGVDDFNVCRKYPELEMFTPVDHRGIMTSEAHQYEGQHYSKAVPVIIEDLRTSDALFAEEKIIHSYPHCWRCKNPIIFRATKQWFASVEAIKDTAIKACEEIEWLPTWGKDRMIAMLIERSDWCISRQRHWGLPIPVFYCKSCEKPVCTPETIDNVAKLFAEKGSNAWYEMDTSSLLPSGFVCPHCSANDFDKGSDSLDCWFDSGSTHADVLSSGRYPNLTFPADLYIEGGDQFRGWFQSSMLTSIAINGVAPYKKCITVGWTVDANGKAMHKSLGNAVSPDEFIRDYGADVLRLWVASTDYRNNVSLYKEIAKQLSEIYLKIRNTARFILGNLSDFDPNEQVAYEDLSDLDRFALSRLNQLVKTVRTAYGKYEYHPIYHAVHNFCTVDMSNLYLDIIKDTLYCDGVDSVSRRGAQTTMYIILDSLVRILAPILAFTSEEIWQAMPHHSDVDVDSVLFNQMPEFSEDYVLSAEQDAYWDKMLKLRTDVYKALEIARTDKVIGKSLDADVSLHFNADGEKVLAGQSPEPEFLKNWLIVSGVEVIMGAHIEASEQAVYLGAEFPGVAVSVKLSGNAKCVRCWMHDESVGKDSRHSELCLRCCNVVQSLGG